MSIYRGEMPTRVRAISVHMGALHTHLRAVHIVLVPVPHSQGFEE